MSTVTKTTQAVQKVRDAIETRIVDALANRQGAVLVLAQRDVEVGRLLNELRETFTEGKTADQSSAFNAEAERITEWSYPMFRRVMQAATTADRVDGSAEACKGSIEALAALSRYETEKATEILELHAEEGETPTAKTIRALGDEPSDPKDAAKKQRDAANRALGKVSDAIGPEVSRTIGAAMTFPENVQKVVLAALLQGMRIGAAHGPLSAKVAESAIRAAKKQTK